MPTWLTLMIIVLVAVALFADLRRNSVDDVAGADELPKMRPDLMLRPNVRDVLENGHRGAVPRPLNVRRSGQDVRKHR